MIGYLSGRLMRYRNGVALIETGGVGYEVHCGEPHDHANCVLYVHHYQTEHGDALYGFPFIAWLDLFRELLKLDKVGPKAAHLVVTAMGVQGVLGAVARKDANLIAKCAKGVGPKTAARIVAELPESVIREFAPELLGAQKMAKTPASDVERDAESALRHMGYAAKEAREAIAATEDAERAELQRLLAASLKLLGRKKG